jgi:hypothetical protein
MSSSRGDDDMSSYHGPTAIFKESDIRVFADLDGHAFWTGFNRL